MREPVLERFCTRVLEEVEAIRVDASRSQGERYRAPRSWRARAERQIGVKRAPELRDLSDDHHTGLVLARRCKQASRSDSGPSPEEVWEEVLEAFAGHLEPHFQIEEDHLLPGLDAIGEASLAERIREDHGALRTLRASESVSRALLDRFGELLEAHIRFEERQVFDPTQQRLPAQALADIAAACRAHPRICPASLKT